MLEILAQAQKAAVSNVPSQICGLEVRFSLHGDADVSWDLRTSPYEPHEPVPQRNSYSCIVTSPSWSLLSNGRSFASRRGSVAKFAADCEWP